MGQGRDSKRLFNLKLGVNLNGLLYTTNDVRRAQNSVNASYLITFLGNVQTLVQTIYRITNHSEEMDIDLRKIHSSEKKNNTKFTSFYTQLDTERFDFHWILYNF